MFTMLSRRLLRHRPLAHFVLGRPAPQSCTAPSERCASTSSARRPQSGSNRRLRELYVKRDNYFKSGDALADNLMSNVTYFDPKDQHGIVVVNKPAGVAVKSCESAPVGLEQALKPLADRLEVGRLHYVSAPERFTSGITILSSKEKSVRWITRCVRRSSFAHRKLSNRYLALTMGFPLVDEVEEVVTLLAIKGERKNEAGVPILESVIQRESVSKRRYLRNSKHIFRTSVHMRTEAKSARTPSALVSIAPLNPRNHFVSAYLCHQLAPIIGEPLYGGRVRSIMGKNVRVEFNKSHLMAGQVLPEVMLDRLGLAKGEEHLLPKHLHLFRVFLPDIYGKEEGDLFLYAPPPKYFNKTAEALSINMNLDKLMEEDKLMDAASIKEIKPSEENEEEESNDLSVDEFVETTHVAARDLPKRS